MVEENKKKSAGRPPQKRTKAQAIEEMKLGRFAKQEPLRIPEKELRRGWQIVGGMGLLLGAAVGIYALALMVMTAGEVMSFGAWLASGKIDTLSLVGGMGLATVLCLVAGVMLLIGKRVPRVIWVGLILAVTMVLLSVSWRTYRRYEERLCYENYPGIYPGEERGSQCPNVENDLILLSLRNLAIYTVGLVGAWLAGRKKAKQVKMKK